MGSNATVIKPEDFGGHWGVHPDYPVEDWKYEVQNDDTRQSYWEWVQSRVDEAAEESSE